MKCSAATTLRLPMVAIEAAFCTEGRTIVSRRTGQVGIYTRRRDIPTKIFGARNGLPERGCLSRPSRREARTPGLHLNNGVSRNRVVRCPGDRLHRTRPPPPYEPNQSDRGSV